MSRNLCKRMMDIRHAVHAYVDDIYIYIYIYFFCRAYQMEVGYDNWYDNSMAGDSRLGNLTK